MNCWELLGLEPTSDKKKIKKAYAVKLKELNVEEQAGDFQQLKEAFDSALFLSGTIIDSSQSKTTGLMEESLVEQMESIKIVADERSEIDLTDSEALPENIRQESDLVGDFTQKLTVIYETCDFFSDPQKWTVLFSKELEWTIEEYNQIAYIMQQFLLTNYRVLSKKVIEYLGHFFDFDALAMDYRSGNYFCYTWREIKQVPAFSFDNYEEIEKEQRIDYFTQRYELFRIFSTGIPDPSVWQERLYECKKTVRNDFDVINLEIAYLLMNDFRLEKEQTITDFYYLFERAEKLKTNSTSTFFKAYVDWVRKEQPVNHILTFDRSETVIPSSTDHLLMGYVYFQLNRYSNTKECWEELSKQIPSLFKADELAVLSPSEPVAIQQKKQKGTGYYIWVFFVIMMFLLKFSSLASKSSKKPSYTTISEVQTLFSGESATFNKRFIETHKSLKESKHAYDQFLYYFYVDPEDEEKETFIEEKLTGSAKEMAQNVTISELPEQTIKSRYDFYVSPDNVKEYGLVTAVTMHEEEEPFLIFQEDEQDKISNVFGQGWTLLPEEKFADLWADIQVRPLMSQKFFVVYYLLSDERGEHLQENPEYTTDPVKEQLEKHLEIPLATEFEGGTWQMTRDEEGKLYTIVNDENDEPRFILSYDDYGRLEHIYGEQWEKLDEPKQKQLYEQAEEKIGSF
jgi:hypothetical protein